MPSSIIPLPPGVERKGSSGSTTTSGYASGDFNLSASSSRYYNDPVETSSTVSRSDSVCSCLSCCGPPLSYKVRRGSSPGTSRAPLPHGTSRVTSVMHEEEDHISVRDVYKFDAILGEGTFSVVYLAESLEDPDGLVAIKVVDKECALNDDHVASASTAKPAPTDLSWLIEKEMTIMSQLDHPHIVHLNEVYHESHDNTVCFVMELAKGGEVFDRLLERGVFSETQASAILVQLLCAVNYLHEQGIVHRDLKLENLLFYDDTEDSKILVADFGLSEFLWELEEDSPLCGTPGYMAPEVIAERHVSPAADVWSIGVITYLLLAGYPPFCPSRNREEEEIEEGDIEEIDNSSEAEQEAEDNEEELLLKLIVEGKYEFHPHSWRSISEEAKDFIRQLMQLDPTERLSCEEALSHPWLSGSQRRTVVPHERTPLEERKRVRQRNAFLRNLLFMAVLYLVIVSYMFSLNLISSCLPITSAILEYCDIDVMFVIKGAGGAL